MSSLFYLSNIFFLIVTCYCHGVNGELPLLTKSVLQACVFHVQICMHWSTINCCFPDVCFIWLIICPLSWAVREAIACMNSIKTASQNGRRNQIGGGGVVKQREAEIYLTDADAHRMLLLTFAGYLTHSFVSACPFALSCAFGWLSLICQRLCAICWANISRVLISCRDICKQEVFRISPFPRWSGCDQGSICHFFVKQGMLLTYCCVEILDENL